MSLPEKRLAFRGMLEGWADEAFEWAESERAVEVPDHIPPSELPDILDASGRFFMKIGELVAPHFPTDEELGLLPGEDYTATDV